jgi:CMP-N,N'-diacetyllegionaminic acid synthase
MYNDKRILAIIPARGGSKGLPGKNIKLWNRKPLMAWTILQAQNCELIDEILVSTEDSEIAEIVANYGSPPPFLRPSELAQDESPISDAILNALERYETLGKTFDFVALLEPTSPLRAEEDLSGAIIKLCDNSDADSLVSVGEVHMEHPMIIKKIDKDGLVVPYIENTTAIYQRQQADKAYFPYGVVYICKTEVYKELKTFYTPKTIPFMIERWQNYEVDDQIDFNLTEYIEKLKSKAQL